MEAIVAFFNISVFVGKYLYLTNYRHDFTKKPSGWRLQQTKADFAWKTFFLFETISQTTNLALLLATRGSERGDAVD